MIKTLPKFHTQLTLKDWKELKKSIANTNLDKADFEMIDGSLILGYFENLEDVSFDKEEGFLNSDYVVLSLATNKNKKYHLAMRRMTKEDIEEF
jgi:Zn-dependent M16 (insulinase) family peptidase